VPESEPPSGRATERGGPTRIGQIAIPVGDLDATYRTLSGRGVAFLGPPHRVARLPDHDLWMAFCRDSEQNLLALMSEVRPD
jgi:methylmalonyl-CoA/ethylmalonyl-CoA epimerase